MDGRPVIWLAIGGSSTASSRIRAFNIAERLAERGMDATCMSATGLKGRYRALSLIRKSRPAPIVVIQKILYGAMMLRLIRWRARLLVWECDDALHLGFPTASRRELRRTRRLVRRTLEYADVVTTSNPLLAEELRPIRGSTVVYRGPAPDVVWSDGPRERIVVWLGSPSTEDYLELLGCAPEHLKDRGWSLVAIGATTAVESLGWRAVPWSLSAERAWLGRALVGVMPQRRDPWSDRKQGYKLFEYMAHGVVPVASDVPAAQAVLSWAGLGSLLVPMSSDWVSAIESAAERRSIYLQHFHTVLDRYSLSVAADVWTEAIGARLS